MILVTEPSHSAVTIRFDSPAPRRLLLLSTDMGMGGGAEEQVIRLAYAFQDRGWEARIVSMIPPSPMPRDFERRGIPLEHLGMTRGVPNPWGLFRLAKIVRTFRPDVVHSHMVHANLLARAVRLIRPFPALICTHHNLTMAGVARDRTGLFETLHALTDRLADRATAISHSAADYYVRRKAVPASKMVVVPNGIDLDRFAPDHAARKRLRSELGLDGQFVWVAVARLEQAKAYPTMLHAFARLGDGPRRLLICGQGTQRGALERLAGSLGIADRVRFLGLRDDIPAVLSASDAFALSSDLEGLPLVLLQASAAGLPIVATDVGGNAEVVVPGANGYLVPAGDPEAFAREMTRMESIGAASRASMGREGQARVRKRFEAEHVMERWAELYAELLKGEDLSHPRRFARTAAKDDRGAFVIKPAATPGDVRGSDYAT